MYPIKPIERKQELEVYFDKAKYNFFDPKQRFGSLGNVSADMARVGPKGAPRSLDEIYKSVMESETLTAGEKKQFQQYFITLYSLNKKLGEAFLLATYAALSN